MRITVGDIVVGEFSPNRPALKKFDINSLVGRLEQWDSELPAILRNSSADKSMGPSFWAAMLDSSYQ